MVTDNSPKQPADAPRVKRLDISRFRGLRDFTWAPSTGLNLILGGGDSGKSTILDALSLLFSPSASTLLADTDYFERRTEDGFSIEAWLHLPTSTSVHKQSQQLWPWHWDGSAAVQPPTDADLVPVFHLRVSGNADLEITYDCVLPDGETVPYTVNLRRSIGLVRLGGDDRNDRDLRLVQGSALERLLADPQLRSRLGVKFSQTDVVEELKENAKESLKELDEDFSRQSLPTGLGLGMNASSGQSINALITLTAQSNNASLPLTSWGAGTRRLSALAIAEAWGGAAPLTIVDEIERGLEPYRQRAVVGRLAESGTQSFVTTHSATAIKAAGSASLWHMAPTGQIGCLDAHKTRAHQRRDPEIFLARLALIAEGVTEVGFARALLTKNLCVDLDDYGVHLSEAQGHDTALDVLEALNDAGLHFGGFVDDEGRWGGRWSALKATIGPLLMQWPTGCTEENVLRCFSDDQLIEFAVDRRGGFTGTRRNSVLQRLRLLRNDPALQAEDWSSLADLAGADLRGLIIASALGRVPDGYEGDDKADLKANAKIWFKNRTGGAELYEKASSAGQLGKLPPRLLDFVNAIAARCGLASVHQLQ